MLFFFFIYFFFLEISNLFQHSLFNWYNTVRFLIIFIHVIFLLLQKTKKVQGSIKDFGKEIGINILSSSFSWAHFHFEQMLFGKVSNQLLSIGKIAGLVGVFRYGSEQSIKEKDNTEFNLWEGNKKMLHILTLEHFQ